MRLSYWIKDIWYLIFDKMVSCGLEDCRLQRAENDQSSSDSWFWLSVIHGVPDDIVAGALQVPSQIAVVNRLNHIFWPCTDPQHLVWPVTCTRLSLLHNRIAYMLTTLIWHSTQRDHKHPVWGISVYVSVLSPLYRPINMLCLLQAPTWWALPHLAACIFWNMPLCQASLFVCGCQSLCDAWLI